MKNFDELFDGSKLPKALKLAKTLSKEECRYMCDYMEKHKPKVVLEFGVQYGCSTAVFLHISQWLGLDIKLHSWDIRDFVRKECVQKKDFSFHLDNITGKEDLVLDNYCPDFIFLDAHDYQMTRNLMLGCIKRGINFAVHDVYLDALREVKQRSKDFTDFSIYLNWEIYLLGDLISKRLWEEDFYEDDIVKVNCSRLHGGYGLAIVEFKKQLKNEKSI